MNTTDTRIYVVEDEALIAMEISDRLGQLGYHICGSAARGEVALTEIPACRPDAVLMDIRLAGKLTGIETARQLRGAVDVPVVFLSAFSDPKLIDEALQTGSFGYLVKPFEERELHATLQAAIYRHKLERLSRSEKERLEAAVEARTAELRQTERMLREREALLSSINANLENIVRERTAALAVSNERFQLVNRATFDVIWDQDLSTGAIWWNEHFTKVFGHTPEEAGRNGDYWRACLHPDDRERVIAHLRDVLKSGKDTWSDHYRFRRKNGSYAHVEDRAHIIRDTGGRPIRLLGAMQDVTRRTLAEGRLRQSELRFRAVFDRSPIIVALFSFSEGRVVELNAAALAALGHSRAEAVGRTALELALWCSLADRERFLSALRGTGHVTNFETPLRRKNGEIFTALMSASRIEIAGKAYSLTSILDITAQREIEERFRHVFENTPIGIYRTTPDGRVVLANPALLRMVGCSSLDELAARNLQAPEWFVEQSRASFEAAMKEQGVVHGFESAWRRVDGSTVFVRESARAIRGAAGEILFYEGTAEDITARRQTEAESARVREQAFRVQKYEALGNLAGGVAHDFNNILTGVLNYTALAVDECPPTHPQIKEFLTEVLRCGERARELVRQILLFSRAEEGRQEPLLLQNIVKEVLGLLRATLPATATISARLDPRAPVVCANPTQIHQVVMNLVINASHALNDQPGRIEIRLDQRMLDAAAVRDLPDLAPGPHVRIEVTDTGCGMTPAVLARIFEPFFTTKPVGIGTGLGLAVVHSVVRSHRGAIAVRSKPGEGTTFELFFPAEVKAAGHAVPEVASLSRGCGEHILLVDDEPAVLRSTELVLTRLGYRVTASLRAEDALTTFAAAPERYAAVITDLQMPGMTGCSLAERVRERRPGTPVLIASGFSGAHDAESLLVHGVSGLLHKPVAPEDLAAALARIFEREPAAASTL